MNVKQVIVIRKDLKMRRGKEIAQGAHASWGWIRERLLASLAENDPVDFSLGDFSGEQIKWVTGSFAKVCCQVNSESELLELDKAARAVGLASYLIQDEGRTEFGGVPTYTALAIGPDESEKIDLITGNLELY